MKIGYYKSKGFTLIELLVVIAIIGLLSSVVLTSLGTARAKARDAKRLSDIKSIYTALQIYQDRYGCLPMTSGSTCGNSGGINFSNAGGWDYSSQGDFIFFLATGTDPIMKKVPVDPINNMPGDQTADTYGYRYYCYNVDPKGLSLGYWKESPVRAQFSYPIHRDPDFNCQ